MLSLVCARRRICNERKERDPISLCTNENEQLQSAGGMGQLATTNWAQPDKGQLEAVDWLVKLPPVGCVQLSLTRLKGV